MGDHRARDDSRGPGSHCSLEPGNDIPRRPDGRPDLTGTYDIGTLTPVERPPEYGDKLTLTDEEAAAIGDARCRCGRCGPAQRPRPRGAARGWRRIAGRRRQRRRLRLLLDRSRRGRLQDRRQVAHLDHGRSSERALSAVVRGGPAASEQAAPFVRANDNDGTAFWIDLEVGPYDDPELRPLQERCVLSRSRSGPPALPALYNNLKRIIQTDDHVMILAEQIHDARIIRLDAEHGPEALRKWMGDSVGHWEGIRWSSIPSASRPRRRVSTSRRICTSSSVSPASTADTALPIHRA